MLPKRFEIYSVAVKLLDNCSDVRKKMVNVLFLSELDLFVYVAGIKEYESNQQELILEPAIKWAASSNITLVVKFSFMEIPVQVCRSLKL